MILIISEIFNNSCIALNANRKKSLPRKVLTLIVSLLITTTIQAQTAKITISLKETSIENVINIIRDQADIDFIYNHEELKNCPKISVSLVEATVDEVLSQCFRNTGFTYTKVNNTIVIIPLKEEPVTPDNKPEILTQTLRGVVIDSDSKIALPSAIVVVLNVTPFIGTATDLNGNFKIDDLPVGRYSIKVSYVGYKDVIVSALFIGSAKEVDITVELSEEVRSLGEVYVSSKSGEPINQMATVSARSFGVEEAKRYAASISDPARMAQVFAGVSGGDDSSNEIIIRGNSPNWLLWMLEGVEIPSPNHFAEVGYTSGSVSILSANMLGISDFYTGAFPAEYGNALSGVFDIKLRNGNNKRNEYSIQTGVLGIDLSAEGPFKNGYDGSYLVNYRYSTFALMNQLNIKVSENALPNYQDLSFKMNLPAKKAGIFSIWAIGGLADDDEKYLPDSTSYENLENGYMDFTKTGMYAAGISHTIFPGTKSYIRTIISSSLSYSSESFDKMDSGGSFYRNIYDRLLNTAIRVNTLYNRKISNRLTMRTGVTLNHLNYDLYSQQADTSRILKTFINGTGRTNLFQGYLQTKYKFSDKLIFTAGLHYAYFALSSNHSIEPRLGLVMKLPYKQQLSFGLGRHSKNENLPAYFVEIKNPDGSINMPNLSLKMTRSTHYVAAYERMLGEKINIKIETYYQNIIDLPVSANPDKIWSPIFGGIFPEDTLSNIGKGRNYGLELTLQRFFTNNYYFLITSSWFNSKYRPANGIWYNTKYNINYINNFVGGKEFKWGENRLIGINSKIIWSGGKRFIPLDLDASIKKGEAVYKTDELYSTKGKDYFRIDFGFNLHFFKEKSEHIISVDIQNLTNRINQWAEEYDPESESVIYYPMAGIIPILNYRLEF